MKSPFSYFIISVFGSLLLLFLIPHAYAGYYNVEYATNQNVHCSGYVAGTTTSCTTPNNITGYIDVVFNNYYTANAFTIYKNSVQIGGTYTSWFNSNHSVNYASDVYSINCPACSYVWVSLSYHIVSNATGPNRIIFSNTTNYNNSITAHPLNETFYVNTWIEDSDWDPLHDYYTLWIYYPNGDLLSDTTPIYQQNANQIMLNFNNTYDYGNYTFKIHSYYWEKFLATGTINLYNASDPSSTSNPNCTHNCNPTGWIVTANKVNSNWNFHTCAGNSLGYFYMIDPGHSNHYATYVSNNSCSNFSFPVLDMVIAGGEGVWTAAIFDNTDLSFSKAYTQFIVSANVLINFSSVPSGAEIIVNGITIGSTPLDNWNTNDTAALSIIFRKNGYYDYPVSGYYTTSTNISVNLIPHINSTPPGDWTVPPTTPPLINWTVTAYKVGSNWEFHTCAADALGYFYTIGADMNFHYASYLSAGTCMDFSIPVVDMVAVGGEGTWTAAIFDAANLSESKAYFQFIVEANPVIYFVSVPTGADLTINGAHVGQTPYNMSILDVTDLDILFTKSGYKPYPVTGHFTTSTTVTAILIEETGVTDAQNETYFWDLFFVTVVLYCVAFFWTLGDDE